MSDEKSDAENEGKTEFVPNPRLAPVGKQPAAQPSVPWSNLPAAPAKSIGATINALTDSINRTGFAKSLVGLAARVNERMSTVEVGECGGVLRLRAPEGVSTGGGKQAREALVLDFPGAERPIVLGHVAGLERTGELRTYEYLLLHCRHRLGREFPVGADEWALVHTAITAIFENEGIRLAEASTPQELLDAAPRRAPSPSAVPAAPPAPAEAPTQTWLILLGGMVLGGGAMWFIFRLLLAP